MNRSLIALLSSAILAAPASAADTATLRLVAYVPVACSLEVLDASVSDGSLTMMVRRNCNTSHRLIVDGAYEDALGNLTVRYNDASVAAPGGTGSIAQPEAYYDGVDRLVIESDDGEAEDLIRYAQTLRVSLETA